MKHLPCVRAVIHGGLIADVAMFLCVQGKLRLGSVDVCLGQG